MEASSPTGECGEPPSGLPSAAASLEVKTAPPGESPDEQPSAQHALAARTKVDARTYFTTRKHTSFRALSFLRTPPPARSEPTASTIARETGSIHLLRNRSSGVIRSWPLLAQGEMKGRRDVIR